MERPTASCPAAAVIISYGVGSAPGMMVPSQFLLSMSDLSLATAKSQSSLNALLI
jgi:hypothetical protein